MELTEESTEESTEELNYEAFLPGILAVYEIDPDAAKIYKQLAQLVLRRESTLSIVEKEFVASYVNKLNCTYYYADSHRGIVKALGGIEDSNRMLDIIHVINDCYHLYPTLKSDNLTQKEVTEIIQITSAFCMYNRLVTCINPKTASVQAYIEMTRQLIEKGYL